MRKTNLLFILSDEHNRDFIGCYGNPAAITPNIDRLAAEGARFKSAYCNSPLCCPSRASMMTGQYPNQTGYWDNTFAYDGRIRGWNHILREQGHEVVSVGKLHFRSSEEDNGFSEEILPMHIVGGIGDLLGLIRDDIPLMEKFRGYITGAEAGESTYTEYDMKITELAVEWLRKRAEAEAEKPWVLHVGYVAPHMPFIAPQQFFNLYDSDKLPLHFLDSVQLTEEHPYITTLKKHLGLEVGFEEKQLRQVIAAYYGLCSFVDNNIGKLLDCLEETGLMSNTRIIYTSDHGECMGKRGLWGKSTLYEESVAIPLIISGPGIAPGTVCDQPVSLVDLFPTVLKCVGADISPEDLLGKAGKSLFEVLELSGGSRAVFAEFHGGGTNDACFMVRTGSFKFICHINHPSQLFDLENDPGELHNLIEEPDYQEIRAQLEEILQKIADVEETNQRAKADQQSKLNLHGGKEAVLNRGSFGYTPTPGEQVIYK
jgi:choline-sulfatase